MNKHGANGFLGQDFTKDAIAASIARRYLEI